MKKNHIIIIAPIIVLVLAALFFGIGFVIYDQKNPIKNFDNICCACPDKPMLEVCCECEEPGIFEKCILGWKILFK